MVEQITKTNLKQTEIGTIPTDWNVKELGEIGVFSKGRGISKGDVTPNGLPCVRYGELYTHYNDYIRSFVSFISPETAKNSRRLRRGDLLFTGSGETAEDIGKCVAFLGDEEAYAGGDIIILSPVAQNSMFLGYLLNHSSVVKQKAAMSQGEVIVHIQARNLAQVKIGLPQQDEQIVIANVLSDIDGLLEGLGELIAKKKNIKQGAMQELLTSRKRLAGYVEKWEENHLGNAADITMGQSPESRFYNYTGDGLPLVQGMTDIENRKTIPRVFTSVAPKTGRKGDIIMSVRAPVGAIARATFDCCLGRGVCAISYENDFLYHLLIFFENRWGRLSKGSTFDSVNYDEVNEFEIALPPSTEEQLAISQVLSDMDAEIEELERQREKFVIIKQGLMQQLLTGRIRLR